MTVINNDEWELVGGIYRRKNKNSNSGGWLVLALFALILLSTCS
ncbi:hypothetical protein [Sphingobium terrigena]|nr:hypothetical protein [Sphingobium terrigena]